jgi:hypothetical protein
LRDLEHGRTDLVAIADADLVVAKPFDGEVLPELSVYEVVSSEFALPVPVGVELVDEHGTLLAAVPPGIALTVAIDVELAHAAGTADRILEDAGEDGFPRQSTSFGMPTLTDTKVPTRLLPRPVRALT